MGFAKRTSRVNPLLDYARTGGGLINQGQKRGDSLYFPKFFGAGAILGLSKRAELLGRRF